MRNNFKLGINIVFLAWLSFQIFSFSLVKSEEAVATKVYHPEAFVKETKDLHGRVIAISGRVEQVMAANMLWLKFYQITDEQGQNPIWIKLQGKSTLPEIGEYVMTTVVIKEAFRTNEGNIARVCTEVDRRLLEEAGLNLSEPRPEPWVERSDPVIY
jgi:hypothetical protein